LGNPIKKPMGFGFKIYDTFKERHFASKFSSKILKAFPLKPA